MTRKTNRLTARTVATLKTPGRHADGGNLYLSISETAGGLSRRWVFLYAFDGRQREAGFGPVAVVSLAQARRKAADWRSQLQEGIDPLDARQAADEAREARKSFGEVALELIEAKRPEWRNPVHARCWELIETQAAAIWQMPVDAIAVADVLRVLTPLWQRVPTTASRVRGRIEMVLDAAKAQGLRSGENPAQWKGNLSHLLPRQQKVERQHHAAMDYQQVRGFLAELRKVESVAALALEFCILTAGRSAEVREAQWSEIDFVGKVWTIAGSRMKGGREHRVPLSIRALAILESMATHRCSNYIFPGHRRNQPIGKTCFAPLVPKGVTTHGFRSSFRDYAGNETHFPREVCESALAHSVGNTAEQAYRRGDALEKRRALMESWVQFCEPVAGGNVVTLRN